MEPREDRAGHQPGEEEAAPDGCRPLRDRRAYFAGRRVRDPARRASAEDVRADVLLRAALPLEVDGRHARPDEPGQGLHQRLVPFEPAAERTCAGAEQYGCRTAQGEDQFLDHALGVSGGHFVEAVEDQ